MKQESTEENSVYMGSAMENKGIMYVLASKPYHEVKEPGYRTVMIGQDLSEEYEEKKDDSGRPETGRSDRKKKENCGCNKFTAEYIGICSSDRYFVDAGRLLSVKKMQKLLEQTPVILGDCLTGQSEKLVQKNRKAESIDEPEKEEISSIRLEVTDLACGTAKICFQVDEHYYYENISELTGTEVTGEYQLISMIKELSEKRKEYEKVADAVQSVEMKGYGVVSPKLSDIKMDDPVLIKHGNKFGVKIKAVAPSVHMIRANIETEIAPIVGSEEQANDLIHYIKEGQSTEDGVWGTSIFGKSIGELMEDGIRSKIGMMDDESQMKLQDTMQKVVNDNNGGLVCIII